MTAHLTKQRRSSRSCARVLHERELLEPPPPGRSIGPHWPVPPSPPRLFSFQKPPFLPFGRRRGRGRVDGKRQRRKRGDYAGEKALVKYCLTFSFPRSPLDRINSRSPGRAQQRKNSGRFLEPKRISYRFVNACNYFFILLPIQKNEKATFINRTLQR